MTDDLHKGIVQRGENEALWVPGGQIIDIKVDGTVTGGAFMLLEVRTDPGGGAPLHTHTREDETLIQIEGTVTVTVGGVTTRVGPGEVVFFPRGTPHAFTNATGVPTRGYGVVSPAGTEAFFREIGLPKRGERRPQVAEVDSEAMLSAMQRAGMIPSDSVDSLSAS